jgi:hypothetical protein
MGIPGLTWVNSWLSVCLSTGASSLNSQPSVAPARSPFQSNCAYSATTVHIVNNPTSGRPSSSAGNRGPARPRVAPRLGGWSRRLTQGAARSRRRRAREPGGIRWSRAASVCTGMCRTAHVSARQDGRHRRGGSKGSVSVDGLQAVLLQGHGATTTGDTIEMSSMNMLHREEQARMNSSRADRNSSW